MRTEEALALLELDWPKSNKLSCPNHSDSDPSLHLYPGEGGFYCFSCGKGGDGLTLLSHFTGKPIGEILSEHGITLGPRGRSRWQQIEDLERRALSASHEFTLAMRKQYGQHGFQHVNAAAEKVEWLWPDLFRFDEEAAPSEYHRMVREVEKFYDSELAVHQGNHSLVVPVDERFSRPVLRRPLQSNGRHSGGSIRVRLRGPD